MKKLFYFLGFTLLFSLAAQAQNEGISFQGLARNAAGEVLVSQKISLRLSILLGSESGTAAYVETRQVTTNPQGIFAVVLGDANALTKSTNFSTINWTAAPKFIKVEMDSNAGTNFTAMGTTKLQAVPFAYYAFGVDAENVEGILPVGSGGTGVASISELKTSLGLDVFNNAALDTKVDKVAGKGLSTNDYTTAEKNRLEAIKGTNTGDQDLSGYATNVQLATKVDKEIGKGLSSNDYTTAEKVKLAAITGNVAGPAGPTGATGAIGPAGVAGATGPAGPTGPQGLPGEAGVAGADGATGPTGATGPIGPAGLTWKGAWSATGTYAKDDAVGYNGASYFCLDPVSNSSTTPTSDPTKWALLASQGATGLQGATGPRGVTGATGPTGPTGAAGPQGIQGLTGPTGATGPAGVQGIAGPIGPAGLTWKGIWSATGAYIKDDVVGFNGASYFCLAPVSNSSTTPTSDPTKWALLASQGVDGPQGPTGSAGATGPQGPIGLTGAQGPTGAAGAQGLAGSDGATGPQGATGLTGATGATGAQGPIGLTGAAGTNGKTVANGTTNPASGTGVDGDFYINTSTNTLFGPKASGAWPSGISLVGPQGTTGSTGAAGAQGIQGATGATGAAGPTPAGTGLVTVNNGSLQTPGALTGDVTTTGGGLATTIGAGKVTNSMLAGSIDLTSKVTGALPVANGGTGLSTTPANGQLDIGNGSGFTRATLTAGTGITITNASGAITIASSAGSSGVPYTGATGGVNLGGYDLTVNELTIGSGKVGASGSSSNTIVGGAGVSRAFTTVLSNTAIGFNTMSAATPGNNNTAIGAYSLVSTTGRENSVVGAAAMERNLGGNENTAIGYYAMQNNLSGSGNTALGYKAGFSSDNTTINNATAIGYQAKVAASNTIQLGADGTNGTTAITNVKTSGTITAGTVTYPNAHNSTTGQVLTINNAGTASWASSSSAGVPYTGATGGVNLGGYDLTVNELTFGSGKVGASGSSSNTIVGGAGVSRAFTTVLSNTAIGYNTMSAATPGNNNTAVGAYSLVSTTGRENSVLGAATLERNLGGNGNTAIGYYSLRNNTTGSNNTALGHNSLIIDPPGSNNTMIGASADLGATNLTNATAIGYQAKVAASNTIQLGADGTNSTTAITNVKTSGTLTAGTVTYPNTHRSTAGDVLTINSSGTASWAASSSSSGVPYTGASQAVNLGGYDLTVNGLTIGTGKVGGAGTLNTIVGEYALNRANTFRGTDNTAIGHKAMGNETASSTSAGTKNTAVGSWTLVSSTGTENSALGVAALERNVGGSQNTGIGSLALQLNTTGSNNTAIGYAADVSANNLSNATAIGSGAKVAASNTIQLGNTDVTNVNTSGSVTANGVKFGRGAGNVSTNTAAGSNALSSNTSGGNNTAVGTGALQTNATGTGNTAVGGSALSASTGVDNTALGYNALLGNTTGSNNVGIGVVAGANTTTGGYNISIGKEALQRNTTGSSNVAVGAGSIDQMTTGSNNAVLGGFAGRYYGDGMASNYTTTLTSSILIGYDTRPKLNNGSNEIVIGTSAIGNGSNTTTIGGDSNTDTYLKGNVHVSNALKISGGTPGVGKVLTSDANGLASWATPSTGLPSSGNSAGDMLYWNGTAWVKVAAGTDGQTLTFIGGRPVWSGSLPANTVVNSTTGKIWMDRNLGATRVPTSSTDHLAYGSLYQWGRGSDGHELVNWNGSEGQDGGTGVNGTTSTLSASDTPGTSSFIITTGATNVDWRTGQNNNLWQGVNGINNPCPSGFRIPTGAEWAAEIASWTSQNAAGAFASPLKLTTAGSRNDGAGFFFAGQWGGYWSSTTVGSRAQALSFSVSSIFYDGNYAPRGNGSSVRCIRN